MIGDIKLKKVCHLLKKITTWSLVLTNTILIPFVVSALKF